MSSPIDLSSKKINILFLGGSNTMMKRGYAEEVVRALGEYFEVGRVDNYAIGGTQIGMGLYTTLGLPPTHAYDLIFTAYSISDYTFVKNPGKVAIWRWTFENLLGLLRQHSPQARLHTLMFGRREKSDNPAQQAMFQATREISEQYHAQAINVDEYLRALMGGDPKADKVLYEDDSHYARPLITALAGNFIARVVIAAEHKRKGAPHVVPKVPTPSRLRKTDHSLFAPLGEQQQFKNTRHEVNAVGLKVDGPWQEITLPGPLLQLNYVSTKNSARILIAEEGETPIALDTLHKRVDSGEFSFLMRGLLFNWKKPPTDLGKPRKLALRAVADPSEDSTDYKYVKQFRMMAPRTPEQNNVVYLYGAVFG